MRVGTLTEVIHLLYNIIFSKINLKFVIFLPIKNTFKLKCFI